MTDDEWKAQIIAGLEKLSLKQKENFLKLWAKLTGSRQRWFGTVYRVIIDHTSRHHSKEFTRQEFLRENLERICAETDTQGKTPDKTLDYYMQRLRDADLIEFVDRGLYRLKH